MDEARATYVPDENGRWRVAFEENSTPETRQNFRWQWGAFGPINPIRLELEAAVDEILVGARDTALLHIDAALEWATWDTERALLWDTAKPPHWMRIEQDMEVLKQSLTNLNQMADPPIPQVYSARNLARHIGISLQDEFGDEEMDLL